MKKTRSMRARAALSVGTILLSSAGIGLATTSPAAAADCVLSNNAGVGLPTSSKSYCSVTVGRKAQWSFGPDSSCKKFTPGQTRTFLAPYPFSGWSGLKACAV
ncbi:hypothetical protein H9Y04_41280 [Streptomyces sp. TRM66268-LWL]|uniref:Uncharacterized protein n=1 Tax=Streptomyces polyasparticus TaxID=2767826 RepID=A0ABR7SVS5_9ACTN|nr:hypothetical protein [Streptomyces polyasparticus]MBC9718979.1 hypothetical protein [Streptomyces polyasparticus]